jgi:hypothetical protein
MSIVYTADVFCDGQSCSQWTPGLTGLKPPTHADTRKTAMSGIPGKYWRHVGGKDYCPLCAAALSCKDCKGDTPCEKHQREIDSE